MFVTFCRSKFVSTSTR